MLMRALGIPTAVDFIPYWGDNNNGHTLNALILPDGTCKGYNNKEDLTNGLTLAGKVAKIYRKTYKIQRNSQLYKYQDSEYIPDLFAHHDIIDVTNYYDIPMTDVTIMPQLYTPKSHIIYLSVFSPSGWQPVAWAEYVKGRADFKDIGIGYTSDTPSSSKGEDYGTGCLFLPICFEQTDIHPLTFPFILEKGGVVRSLLPDSSATETIILHRKFPRKKRIVDFARKMKGGYFELSNDPNFAQSELIHFVDSTPSSHKQIISLAQKKKYRYMRFYKRKGGISIGEMGCLGVDNQPLEGTPLADLALIEDIELKNICDGNFLSYFDISDLKDIWVGIDFGKPITIGALFFCPRTDDNDITFGDKYELFYWNKKWISLGKQVATNHQLTFLNVPRNSLLWLRNLTKGKEERPFTYENKKQIWW